MLPRPAPGRSTVLVGVLVVQGIVVVVVVVVGIVVLVVKKVT